jgi:hypothetical protein
MIRAVTNWLRVRLALAEAATSPTPERALKEAERRTRLLERERQPYIEVWTHLGRASVRAQRGDRAAALLDLRQAIALSDAQGRRLYSEVARRREGELVGGPRGEALVVEADEWMRRAGIREPQRIADVVLPIAARG